MRNLDPKAVSQILMVLAIDEQGRESAEKFVTRLYSAVCLHGWTDAECNMLSRNAQQLVVDIMEDVAAQARPGELAVAR